MSDSKDNTIDRLRELQQALHLEGDDEATLTINHTLEYIESLEAFIASKPRKPTPENLQEDLQNFLAHINPNNLLVFCATIDLEGVVRTAYNTSARHKPELFRAITEVIKNPEFVDNILYVKEDTVH